MTETDDVSAPPDTIEPDLMRMLWADLVVLLRLAQRAEGTTREALRRAFVRAGVSLIEASVWLWREHAIHEDRSNSWANGSEPLLSDEERVLLRGQECRIDSDGVVRSRQTTLALIADLKFTLRCLTKVRQFVEYTSIASAIDFEAIRTVKDARNRITHPKTPSDLLIADDEVDATKRALDTLHEAEVEMSPLEVVYADGTKSSDPIRWDDLEREE